MLIAIAPPLIVAVGSISVLVLIISVIPSLVRIVCPVVISLPLSLTPPSIVTLTTVMDLKEPTRIIVLWSTSFGVAREEIPVAADILTLKLYTARTSAMLL